MRRVALPKRTGGARAIGVLAIRDRVAQRAVQQVIEPLFEPLLLDSSFGCRRNVGVGEAVAQVERYAARGLGWVVDADVEQCFDRLDHQILLALLRQRIEEPAVTRLIAQWLATDTVDEGTLTDELTPGLGAVTRQFGGTAWARLLAILAGAAPNPGDPADPLAAPPGSPDFAGGFVPAEWLPLVRPAVVGARWAMPQLLHPVGGWLVAGGILAAGALLLTQRLRAASLGRGAVQGGPLSPLLANIYLHPFDLAMQARGLRLVRYLDDLVVLCPTREAAEEALVEVERVLGRLRLRLNPEKTSVRAYAEGLEFLGRRLAPRQRGRRLEDGLTSFAEAERALREAAGEVGRAVRDGVMRRRNPAGGDRRGRDEEERGR